VLFAPLPLSATAAPTPPATTAAAMPTITPVEMPALAPAAPAAAPAAPAAPAAAAPAARLTGTAPARTAPPGTDAATVTLKELPAAAEKVPLDAIPAALVVRHPPRSGWLDELGRLKGGWVKGLGVARCAPYCVLQNCPPVPSAASCSRM
jgi:hypothetical protein